MKKAISQLNIYKEQNQKESVFHQIQNILEFLFTGKVSKDLANLINKDLKSDGLQ